jgi:hypothetical protein
VGKNSDMPENIPMISTAKHINEITTTASRLRPHPPSSPS